MANLQSGIYIIRNIINDKVYVGSTINFENRRKSHFSLLESGTHWNIKLQRSFDIHGISSFIFEIVEFQKYEKPSILDRENFYIKKLDSKKNGYNIADASFGDTLKYHPNKVEIFKKIQNTVSNWSNEKRLEINNKKARSGNLNGMYDVHRYGEENPMYGKKQSILNKETVSKKNKNKVVVKNALTGESIGQVDVTHEKYLNGEWVFIRRGIKSSLELKAKLSTLHKLRHKLMGTKPPNQKGKFWWNDGIVCIRSTEKPEGLWDRGRLPFKKKDQNG